MPKRYAILDISASRLELTVFTGDTPSATRAQRISPTDFIETWPKCLESLATPLASLVQAAGAQGLDTTIIYQSPTAAVLVAPVPYETGAQQAMQAAMLALTDAANRPLGHEPHDLQKVWNDPEVAQSSPDAPVRQSHFIGIADSDESAASVARLARDAGLRPTSLVPAECLGMVAAVESAIEQSKKSKGSGIALYCGEHFSTLAAATAGRLRFVRRIGISSELLVGALAREIKPAQGESPATTLDHSKAATLLFRNGIPTRGKAFDEESGISADLVLPLIQPVMQRCVVEIKQSLRFGLDETERGGAVLEGLGMGAKIGRCMALIAEQCHLTLINSADSAPATDQPTSTAAGAIHQWHTGRDINARLIPKFLRAKQTAARVRRGMLVGFSAAAALIAYNAVNIRMELAEQTRRVQTARSAVEANRPMTELNTHMLAVQAGVAAARQRIAARFASTTAWDGAMVALAQCTPESVKINDCQMMLDHGKPVCRITGQTPMPATGDANGTLRSYLDALAAVPLVKSARLGATHRAESDRGPIQNFELTITMNEVPAFASDPRTDLAAGSDRGGQP